MSAHVLIDADPGGRGPCQVTADECSGFDYLAIADLLELLAAGKAVPLRKHHEAFVRNGIETSQGRRVLLCLMDDDGSVQLHSYGQPFTEYYARGSAHILRDMASAPQIQQAVFNALAMLERAKAESKRAEDEARRLGSAMNGNGDQLPSGLHIVRH